MGVVFEDEALQAGDLPFLGAVVIAGGGQPFRQLLVVCGEGLDLLLEGGVLGDQALDGVGGQVEFQVADLAEQFTDALALGLDLGDGLLQSVLGVECPFPPGGVDLGGGLLALLSTSSLGAGYCLCDQRAGVGVLVEKGA